MRINVRFQEQDTTFRGFQETDEQIGVGFGDVPILIEKDYNKLVNRPSINSVELIGAMNARDLGLGNVYYDTNANWNVQPRLVAEESVIYIYSDAFYVEDEAGNRTPIAGIKIGDGTSYLIDMPFVSEAMSSTIIRHITNDTVHITAAEREFWNNKISSYLDSENSELLVLSKTSYEQNGSIITR